MHESILQWHLVGFHSLITRNLAIETFLLLLWLLFHYQRTIKFLLRNIFTYCFFHLSICSNICGFCHSTFNRAAMSTTELTQLLTASAASIMYDSYHPFVDWTNSSKQSNVALFAFCKHFSAASFFPIFRNSSAIRFSPSQYSARCSAAHTAFCWSDTSLSETERNSFRCRTLPSSYFLIALSRTVALRLK